MIRRNPVRDWWDPVLDWVFPRHCALCRRVGTALCPECATALRPAPPAPALEYLDEVVALFAYEGAGREVIGRLKFHNHRDTVDTFGSMLALAVDRRVDLVTWVPTSAARRRARGFDQAELIARRVGRALDVPVRPTLRRSPGSGTQTGQGRRARAAIAFGPSAAVSGWILVVDDVRTTGASLSAAASSLRRGGACGVIGATLAATP